MRHRGHGGRRDVRRALPRGRAARTRGLFWFRVVVFFRGSRRVILGVLAGFSLALAAGGLCFLTSPGHDVVVVAVRAGRQREHIGGVHSRGLTARAFRVFRSHTSGECETIGFDELIHLLRGLGVDVLKRIFQVAARCGENFLAFTPVDLDSVNSVRLVRLARGINVNDSTAA